MKALLYIPSMPNPTLTVTSKSEHAGARLERAALLRHLRCELRASIKAGNAKSCATLRALIEWLLARHERYGKREGGL